MKPQLTAVILEAHIDTRYRRRLLRVATVTLWLFLLSMVALVVVDWADACTPAAGLCCQDVACAGDDSANLEIKVQVTPPIPFNVVTPYFAGGVTLGPARRLGVPADAADPKHLVYFEQTGAPGGGGVPLAVSTMFGPLVGTVGGFRWVAVEATKNPAVAPPPAAAGRVFACYFLQNTGTPRFAVAWTDQFGAHDGTVGRPITVCLPINGTPGKGHVCYGEARDVGPGPGPVWIDTPLTLPQHIETDRYDEYCSAIL